MRRVTDPASAIVMQFVAAFGIWLAAERLEMSGRADLVTFAMTVARGTPGITAPRARVISYAVWDTAVFVLNVLAFVLIGIQIGPIRERLTGADPLAALILAGATFATVVVMRLAWVLPTIGPARPRPSPAGAQARLGPGLAVSWAGMRGIVTVAAALALPAEFPTATSSSSPPSARCSAPWWSRA